MTSCQHKIYPNNKDEQCVYIEGYFVYYRNSYILYLMILIVKYILLNLK